MEGRICEVADADAGDDASQLGGRKGERKGTRMVRRAERGRGASKAAGAQQDESRRRASARAGRKGAGSEDAMVGRATRTRAATRGREDGRRGRRGRDARGRNGGVNMRGDGRGRRRESGRLRDEGKGRRHERRQSTIPLWRVYGWAAPDWQDDVGDFAGEAGRRKANSTGSGLVIVDIVCVVRRQELKPQMNDEESARRKTLDLVMIGCSAGSCKGPKS
ncbi:hypothetical protein C8J57DRAFT_1222109 [Mycena rebaudengoi]|nr:hypothetical protein C8J57DRAFT_1222109 [Mycena rebaudengoi]